MAEAQRRRRHAAASARILTAGLSSATAFGMVAGMALTAVGDDETAAHVVVPPGTDTPSFGTARAPAAQDVIVVVRRHWPPGSRAVAVATPAPTPARPPAAQPVAPKPAARPVTRTRGS